ncbi:MAG TPA: hypothetical protein ENI51_06290, partial [Candidatus Atribacteria bacterium]|nr:hypothetical protein [Candidatus Atribacteria bacterium]
LYKDGFIIIPDWADSWIDVSLSEKEIFKKFKKSAREDIVKIKKGGYTYELSTDVNDFKYFYEKLYVPFTKSRHGRLAYPKWWTLNYEEMIGMFKSKRAKLLWIKDGDKYVAGVVMFNRGKIAYPIYMGIDIGSDYWIKCGSAAIYYFSVIWAKENGFKLVRIGDVRAFLNDGLFQYKRKWGVFLNENYSRSGIIGLKICNLGSSAVINFLENNPFIYISKKKLKGFIFSKKNLTAGEVQSIFHKYFTTGLKSLIIVSGTHALSYALKNFDRWERRRELVLPLNTGVASREIFSGILLIEPEKESESARIYYYDIKKDDENDSIGPLERLVEKYNLNSEQAEQILIKGYQEKIEKLLLKYPNYKNIIVKIFLDIFPKLEKKNIKGHDITYEMLDAIFLELSKNKFSREAIPQILKFLVEHNTCDINLAVRECKVGQISQSEAERVIRKVINDNLELVKRDGFSSLNQLMGFIMKDLQGKIDGKIVSELLKNEIEKIISQN